MDAEKVRNKPTDKTQVSAVILNENLSNWWTKEYWSILNSYYLIILKWCRTEEANTLEKY